MSTAKNHAKRSHRSHYRGRMYIGSRKSVVKPTPNKSFFDRLVQKLRKIWMNKKEQKPDA